MHSVTQNDNPIGSMYAIYGNIYHQYTPNVSIYIYIPYMDPMGICNLYKYVTHRHIHLQAVSQKRHLKNSGPFFGPRVSIRCPY